MTALPLVVAVFGVLALLAPLGAAELAACLAAARVRRLADDADYRTPWERQEDGEALIRYELDMIRRSAGNMKALGLM